MGHADRVGPLRDYCTGLMLPGERKSVEPIAAVTRTGADIVRSINRCFTLSVTGVVGRSWCWQGTRNGTAGNRTAGPIEAWIIDDTAFPRRAGIR